MAKRTVTVIDSLHNLTLGHRVTAITYSPLWQGLRLSVSFKDYEAVRRTVGIGLAYIHSATSDDERVFRLIRVRKLLSAVKIYSSFVDVDSATLIQDTMADLSDRLEREKGYLTWDWDTARKQAYAMHTMTKGLFDLMYKDLSQRATRGKKPELRYFLSILDEVINESMA